MATEVKNVSDQNDQGVGDQPLVAERDETKRLAAAIRKWRAIADEIQQTPFDVNNSLEWNIRMCGEYDGIMAIVEYLESLQPSSR